MSLPDTRPKFQAPTAVRRQETIPVQRSLLAVRQFHQMIDESSVYTPLWYAVMDKEDGDNWRNLIKKLLGKAITVDEFVQSAQQYMNFTN